MEGNRVPSVWFWIRRKRYIDYARYLILRDILRR